MNTSINDNKKSRGRPATGKGELIGVRLQPDMLAALDKFVDEQEGITRPEAVRLILRDWLIGSQRLKP
ncbi:hypothetical protein AJ88_45675 [Mesorhizobium amorphae CCBAU 01583]|nr:hypothetical protein AJ88_45675 [Mesorhizobium amorphae CCBAU 01583]